MIEKAKKISAGLASATVLLYVIGYIAEYSHARMLGLSMVKPLKDYYLISGGTFVLSTLYAIYSVIISRFFYFLILIITVAIFLQSDAYIKKKTQILPGVTDAHVSDRFLKAYGIFTLFLTVFFLVVAIPISTSTFCFKNFLLINAEQGSCFNYFQFCTSELRTWILNEGDVNRQKLAFFYVLVIFSTTVSVIVLCSMIRLWKILKAGDSEPSATSNKTFWLKSINKRFLGFWKSLPRYLFGLLIMLMMVAVTVQGITIPVNYGILIKSNHYPEVKVEPFEVGADFLDHCDTTKESKWWLLRGNINELLLYAVFFDKNSGDIVHKLFTLQKKSVKKVEIIDNSFVFRIK